MYMCVYLCIYISATVPLGTPGRVWSNVGFLSFKGPTAPGTIFPEKPALSFLYTFCIFFSK